jgi:putative metallohydrolase (TIGR04338 family)
MARARDTQRKKVYTAEWAIDDSDRKFESVPEIQAFVDKLMTEAWARRRFGNLKIEVRDGRGRSRAGGSAEGRWITLPKWARRDLTICHELAHAVGKQHDKEAAHGPDFARRLLELVTHVMGEEAGARLRERFVAARVKVGPPLVLRDLKPLPAPLKLWRFVATDAVGTATTRDIEAGTLVGALQRYLYVTDGSNHLLQLTVKRIRRPVTIP